ncbi:MAG: glycosyltransferase family 39 protein [Planctomycetaceae bacterium]
MSNPPGPPAEQSQLRDHLPAGAMLLVWLVLALHTCHSTSVTFDEIWHLPVGVRNLVAGDFAEDRLNPPLSRMWAAIPLALRGVQVTPRTAEREIGEIFVAEHDDYLNWYIAGRYFNLLWPVALAVLLYRVADRSFGLAPARLALASLLCCPDLIAHGSIVTPDSSAAFFFFATSVAMAYWFAAPTWRRTITLGTLLGLLQAVKYTGVVFFPTLVMLTLWQLWRGRSPEWQMLTWKSLIGRVAVILFSCLVSLGACYRFQGLFVPLEAIPLQSVDFCTIREIAGGLAKLPLPLPLDYVAGIDLQRSIMETPHPTFLDGLWSLSGFRSYFFKAAAYKYPLALLGLSAIGVVALVRQWRRGCGVQVGSYLVPVAILVSIASFSSMQLGVRYVMPILPLIALCAGSSLLAIGEDKKSARTLLVVVGVIGLLSVWRHHPHHLSYFNELAGGPWGGRYHLVDSNLDWGQDLIRAQAAYHAHSDEPPKIAYFGTVDPRRLGMATVPPPSRTPQPGLYLVSVNYVMGRPGTVREPDGHTRSADINEFAYFQLFEPLEHVGNSIDLYRITQKDCNEYREAMQQAALQEAGLSPGSSDP